MKRKGLKPIKRLPESQLYGSDKDGEPVDIRVLSSINSREDMTIQNGYMSKYVSGIIFDMMDHCHEITMSFK